MQFKLNLTESDILMDSLGRTSIISIDSIEIMEEIDEEFPIQPHLSKK